MRNPWAGRRDRCRPGGDHGRAHGPAGQRPAADRRHRRQRGVSQQVAVSGSIVDAISTLSPSFSPTRQKLSGAGETLRGRSPLCAINGIPQSTPDPRRLARRLHDRPVLHRPRRADLRLQRSAGHRRHRRRGQPGHGRPARGRRRLGQVLAQTTLAHKLGDAVGGKVAGLVGWREGAFDATVGVAYDARGAFYDASGRRIGMDNTQGDVQDSKTLSIFVPLRLADRAQHAPGCRGQPLRAEGRPAIM
ncbi:hypothetical protein ACRAWD_27970 [Caulobacter segnis]